MSGIDVGWGFVGLLMTLMGWLSLSLKFHRRGGSAVGVVPIRLARELTLTASVEHSVRTR